MTETKHRCPAPDCAMAVPHQMLMCARHWRMVPKSLQTAIYESWKGGSGSHGANIREAIRIVTATEGGRKAHDVAAGTKALTIWQPWASLIMMRAKPYEFRRWNFADRPGLRRLVGQRIVIHAGARRPKVSEIDDILERIQDGESALVVELARPWLLGFRMALQAKETGGAPLAAALGTAVLSEPRSAFDLFKDQVADSDRLDQHMYAWPLTDIQPFAEPIPAAGAQGFWNWS